MSKEEKSLEEQKAELEAKLKEIQNQIGQDDINSEEPEKEERWIKIVRKVIVGLWGVIILIVVGIIGLYTYSNYLDKVIADKNPATTSNATTLNSIDFNSIETTTPGFFDNNVVDGTTVTTDNTQTTINQ